VAWLGLIFDQVHSLRVKAGFVIFLVSLFGGSEDYRRLSKTIYRDNFGGGCVNVQRGTVDLLSLIDSLSARLLYFQACFNHSSKRLHCGFILFGSIWVRVNVKLEIPLSSPL